MLTYANVWCLADASPQTRQPSNDPRFPVPWMVPVPMPWGSGTGSWGIGGNALPIDNGPLCDGIRTYAVPRPTVTASANLGSERDQLRGIGHTHSISPSRLPVAAEAAVPPLSPQRPIRTNGHAQLFGVGASRTSTTNFLGIGFRGFS